MQSEIQYPSVRPVSGILNSISIKGFKSIKECNLDLGYMNVLIGSNGSGKSNLLSVFDMLHHVIDKSLSLYVGKRTRNAMLFNGLKQTKSIEVEFGFDDYGYGFTLAATDDNRLIFDEEHFSFDSTNHTLGNGHSESKWESVIDDPLGTHLMPLFKGHAWRIYHFHDTGRDSRMKQSSYINNNIQLTDDAGNLAPFLYRLKHANRFHYDRIVEAVRIVAPYFDDFILCPEPLNKDYIHLEWKAVGNDEPFNAHQLSDGTLRFICLATLLLQPTELQPQTIVIDEPELGLHPAAITVLVDIMDEVTTRINDKKQIIISTQSVELLNQFRPEDIIVVDREDNESVFRRIDVESLSTWVEDYTLGEMWIKNLFGGRP